MDVRELRLRLLDGLVIPAHPLALTPERKLDERRQRGLTRYYLAAGAGGIAMGVHTTQFAVRESAHGLYEPLLALTADEIRHHERRTGSPVVKVAGVIGPTQQALREAEAAARHGYDAALLGLGWARGRSIEELLAHCREVARVLPLFGFYLQPAAGGIPLPPRFWAGLLEIETVVAVKVAPFNRYHTIDVVRPLAESGRKDEVALYTGNDDSIVSDLVTPFAVDVRGAPVTVRFRGGLLGHWACWTRAAVQLLDRIKAVVRLGGGVPEEILALGAQVTDMNAAVFDVANAYRGCIAGVHAGEDVSSGQLEEIERVVRAYPHLVDDTFVAANRERWLA
jgi:dihydrodipicolinate synthase/N-acetylneuraminate lyase